MSSNLLTRPRKASAVQPWPRLAVCACGDEILLARGVRQGHPFRLHPVEVLPLSRCSDCLGRGTVVGELRYKTTGRGSTQDAKAAHYATGPVPCALCGGTGMRGEDLGPDHVLVSAHDGVAQPFEGWQFAWQAAHRRHRCAA